MRLTRRTLLAGSAAFLAACSGKKKPPAPATPPADEQVMTFAYRQEQWLIAAYDAAIPTASPRLRAHYEVERAVHSTHLAALHAFKAPPLPAGTSHPEYQVNTIASVLRSASRSGRQAAVNAVDGANAALLASIAASHATSAESHG